MTSPPRLPVFDRLPDDVLLLVCTLAEVKPLFTFRMTCRRHFEIVAMSLKIRYQALVRPFIADIPSFNSIIRKHGAIISGSMALYFFLPDGSWFPNDMDIYVSDEQFEPLTTALETHPSFDLVLQEPLAQHSASASDSLGLLEIKMYATRTNRMIDVIRSRRNSPVSPLLQFWTTLLLNFITPDACVSAYPRMVFNGKGYVKEFGLSTRDSAAMEKYKTRTFDGQKNFVFIPDSWGTFTDPSYWQKDLFSDLTTLAITFRTTASAAISPLPILREKEGWKLIIPYPFDYDSDLEDEYSDNDDKLVDGEENGSSNVAEGADDTGAGDTGADVAT